MKTHILRLGLALFVVCIMTDCSNKLSEKITPIDCTPFLANLRMSQFELNGTDNCGTYQDWSSFSLLMEQRGDCIGTGSTATVNFTYYDATGFEVQSQTLTTPFLRLLGEQIGFSLCVRFGGQAQYVKITTSIVNAAGKQSNQVSVVIPRDKWEN